jgi:hypothetical protein
MLKELQRFKKIYYDSLLFLPDEEEQGKVNVQSLTYKNKGTPLAGNEMGDSYHIFLFENMKDGTVKSEPIFEAILCDPLEYISDLILADFYGVICKNTTTSSVIVNEIVDLIKLM